MIIFYHFLCKDIHVLWILMRGSRFCFQRSNFDYVFLVDEWREDKKKTLYEGRHWLASETRAFHWRADGGPTLNVDPW